MTAIQKHQEPKPPAQVADTNTFLSFIAEAARDPAVDVSKMERLFEMRERMIDRQAHLEFNAALKAAKGDLPGILRNKYNDQTKSKYANLESVSDAMDPVITQHGFSMSFGTADSPKADHYRVTCTLAHEGGHEKEYFADIPIDSAGIKGTANKTLTHAFGSTMSYGRRYLKMMIFDVKTTDDDGNAAGNPESVFASDDQLSEIRKLMKDTATDEAKFLKFLKEETLDQLSAKKAEHAIGALHAKARAAATPKEPKGNG